MTQLTLELPDTVRVLIVDDDEDDAFLISRMLSHGLGSTAYDVYHCLSAEAAIDEITTGEYDAYLIDYRLGAATGLDILAAMQPELRREPFILMTGADNQDVMDQSMNAAASDFLVKGTFTAETLMKTINFALQRKLFEQQRVAHLIEINRSKDEFISIASHQLRTPATGVKQYVGMLREGFAGELSPQQKLLVEKAYESNERQLTIVADLLRVARVDAGKVTLHREMTDLNRAVRDVVDELRSELRTRHITVRITPNTPVEAMVDQETMRMVLDNLIENAVKYSEDESEIHITLRTDSAATTLSVSDSGVGVEPEHIDELFEKFRRIPNVRSTKVGGTGLGLYWAQKIIQLHGGMITYQRRQPQGSTFRIELPHQQEVTKE